MIESKKNFSLSPFHLIYGLTGFMLFLMMTVSFLNIGNNADTLALLRAFQWDESYLTWEILKNAAENNIYPHWWFNYGHTYQGFCALVLKLIGFGGAEVTEKAAILTARLVSTYSYAVCLFLFFKIQRKLDVEKTTAVLFTAFFASVPDLYYWSQKVHPDLFQMAFMLGGVYAVIQPRLNFKNACISAFLFGVAFGIKYAGAFFVPFVCIFLSMHQLVSGRPISFREELQKYIVIGLVFLSGWLIPNPYVLKFFAELLSDLHTQSHTAHWGYGYEEPKNPLLWLPIFLNQFSAGGGALLLTGLAGFVYFLAASGAFRFNKIKQNPHLMYYAGIGLYCLITTFLLFSQVNYRQVRYSFPLLPFLLLAAAVGYQIIISKFPKRSGEIVSIAALLIIFSSMSLHAMRYSVEFDKSEKRIELVQAGDWLKAHYSPDTPILGDIYSYFPDQYFQNTQTVWGVNQQNIKEHNPKVIVINQVLSGKSAWKKEGTKFQEGQIVMGNYENAGSIYYFQKNLFSGKLPWKVVYEADTVVILERLPG